MPLDEARGRHQDSQTGLEALPNIMPCQGLFRFITDILIPVMDIYDDDPIRKDAVQHENLVVIQAGPQRCPEELLQHCPRLPGEPTIDPVDICFLGAALAVLSWRARFGASCALRMHDSCMGVPFPPPRIVRTRPRSSTCWSQGSQLLPAGVAYVCAERKGT